MTSISPIATPLVAEIGTISISVVLLYAGFRTYGRNNMFAFLGGSLLWTSVIENLGVSTGAYSYYGYSGVIAPWYSGYLLWVGLVPLWVEFGWIIVSLSLFTIFHGVLLPGRSALLKAALAGLFAVNIDIMIDPIAVANRLWVWLNPSIYVLGVPLYNWAGWFLLIFFFDLTFDSTITSPRRMFALAAVEERLFRWRIGSESSRLRISRFMFRTAVLSIVVAILLEVVSLVVGYFA